MRGTDAFQLFVRDKIGSYINERFDTAKGNGDEVWRSATMLNYLADSQTMVREIQSDYHYTMVHIRTVIWRINREYPRQ